MLFYERRGLNYDSYVPEIVEPPVSDDSIDGAGDAVSKDSALNDTKFCSVQ